MRLWSCRRGFDSESSETNDCKIGELVFTVSLHDPQLSRDSKENKPASLLVVPLEKAISGISPFPNSYVSSL